MASSFVDTLELDFLPLFELDGRQHPVPNVLVFLVIDHFDLVEHVMASFIAWKEYSATYPLSLHKIEEALGHRIVMAVAASAH